MHTQDVVPVRGDDPSLGPEGDDSRDPPTARGTRQLAAALSVVTALTAYTAAVAVVFWPGQIDDDTLDEVTSAATGHYNDFHTPLLSALWRVPYMAGVRSPGWILAAAVMTLLIGLYLVLRTRFGRVASTIGAILCCSWPPVLSWAVHVGRDLWFTAFCVCAFGFAARAVRMGPSQRRFNVAATVVMGCLCCATWQIALVPLLALFAVVAGIVLPRRMRHRRLAVCGAALAACVALFGLQTGIEKAIGTKSTYPQQSLFVYDLARLSTMEGKILLPSDVVVPNSNAKRTLLHVPTGGYPDLVFSGHPVVDFLINAHQEASLQHAWIHAIVHDPLAYLDQRTDLTLAQLSITEPSLGIYQIPNSPTKRFRALSTTLQSDGIDYLKFFTSGADRHGDIIFDVWIYGLILVAAVPILLKRREPCDLVVVGLACAALLLAVALFFSISTMAYRFSYGIVAVGTVVAPVLLPRRPWRGTRARQSHELSGD